MQKYSSRSCLVHIVVLRKQNSLLSQLWWASSGRRAWRAKSAERCELCTPQKSRGLPVTKQTQNPPFVLSHLKFELTPDSVVPVRECKLVPESLTTTWEHREGLPLLAIQQVCAICSVFLKVLLWMMKQAVYCRVELFNLNHTLGFQIL